MRKRSCKEALLQESDRVRRILYLVSGPAYPLERHLMRSREVTSMSQL